MSVNISLLENFLQNEALAPLLVRDISVADFHRLKEVSKIAYNAISKKNVADYFFQQKALELGLIAQNPPEYLVKGYYKSPLNMKSQILERTLEKKELGAVDCRRICVMLAQGASLSCFFSMPGFKPEIPSSLSLEVCDRIVKAIRDARYIHEEGITVDVKDKFRFLKSICKASMNMGIDGLEFAYHTIAQEFEKQEWNAADDGVVDGICETLLGNEGRKKMQQISPRMESVLNRLEQIMSMGCPRTFYELITEICDKIADSPMHDFPREIALLEVISNRTLVFQNLGSDWKCILELHNKRMIEICAKLAQLLEDPKLITKVFAIFRGHAEEFLKVLDEGKLSFFNLGVLRAVTQSIKFFVVVDTRDDILQFMDRVAAVPLGELENYILENDYRQGVREAIEQLVEYKDKLC